MVAIDNHVLLGRGKAWCPRLTLAPLVAAVTLGAALLVVGAILWHGFSENGFRLGSQLAWRYTALVFVLTLVAGPLCRIAGRLVPSFVPPEALSRKLVWGFCASYAVYLLSVFVPNVIDLSAGATLMVLFGGTVVLVMAASAGSLARLGRPPLIPAGIRRVLLGVAAVYFWLSYSLMALARISGPHRPDSWYGISLILMIAALLIRYADRWVRPATPVAPMPGAAMPGSAIDNTKPDASLAV